MTRLLSIVLLIGVVSTGCTRVAQTGEGGRANGFTIPHVLRIADGSDVSTLNPHLGQLLTIGRLSEFTMAYLIRWNAKNEPVPELATAVPTKANGGVSSDGLTITYHLRRGVHWSDGVRFDADDVVFSTRAVLNPANNEASRQGWDQIAKVDEPDKYTVVYHLKKPYSPFIEVFFSTAGANPCILPKHLLGGLPNINTAAYNSLPVGIGPFKYASWERGQQIIMLANPLYFRGAPKLQKIIFRIVPDRNTLLAQFQAKQLDLWPLIPGSYVDRAKSLDAYSIETRPSYGWSYVAFQLANPALADPIVRHALLYGLDRKGILEKIYRGLGTLSDSVTPASAPYAVSIPAAPYDPEKANAMLTSDGWALGSDGVREKNGKRLSFNYATYSGYPDVDNQIEFMRADWRKIGVELNVRHYPVAIFFAPLPDGIIYNRAKFDITSASWSSEAIGDYSQVYGCDAVPPHGQNFTGWTSNRSACVAMSALHSLYDQAARNRDIAIVVHALAQDAPAPVLFNRKDAYLVNKDVHGFMPNAVSPFDDFMNVDI